MQAFYIFDFVRTINEQLFEKLNLLEASPLCITALEALANYQTECGSTKGVYCIFYKGKAVYAGKSDSVSERLTQHFNKLRGRLEISLENVGYKAILLETSMSTAANERLLIKAFKAKKECDWNGKGFGPKDPGQERDTTKPSGFDLRFPIRNQWVVDGIEDRETLGQLLTKIKKGLPYLFRWDDDALTPQALEKVVDLTQVPRDAESLLKFVGGLFGDGWQAVVLSHGMILYKNTKKYPHGRVVHPT
jgi:hypothetical protein